MSNTKQHCIGILPDRPNFLHGVCDCGRVYEAHRDDWEYGGTDPATGIVSYAMRCDACGDYAHSIPGKLPDSERKKLLPVDGK